MECVEEGALSRDTFLSVSLKGSYEETKVSMATNICTVVLEDHVKDVTAFFCCCK